MRQMSSQPGQLQRGRIVNEALLAALQFPHLCALYAPASMTVNADKSVSDLAYPALPTHKGVRCYYNGTTNVNEPHVHGNQKMANIFTDDRWYFDADTDVSTSWLIRLKTPGHPLYDIFWVVQGIPQVLDIPGQVQLPVAQVYGIITTKPAGVT